MGRIVGIDLGTTYSLVAYTEYGTRSPRCLTDEQGRALVPSVVSLDSDGRLLVGWPAQEQLLQHAGSSVYSVKRLMGRGFADVQDELKLFPFRIAPARFGIAQLNRAGAFLLRRKFPLPSCAS